MAIALFMVAARIEGQSTILNADPIRRAHPGFVENLIAIGADVEWARPVPLPTAVKQGGLGRSPMTPAQIASVMIVVSGAAHAVVNAILKSGRDKMSSRALIDGFSAIMILPAAFFVPLPHGAWGWLAASGATHLVYLFALIKAFEGADMMVAYPVFRGMAPALAAIIAVAVFHEPINWPVAIGVGLVSSGVLATALGRHMDGRTLAWSLLTGVTIALYTVIDAQGVRAAPSAPSYIVWVFLILGGGHRRRLRPVARPDLPHFGASGVEARPHRRRLFHPHLRPGAVGLPPGGDAEAGGPARNLDPVRRRHRHRFPEGAGHAPPGWPGWRRSAPARRCC